MPIGVGFAEPVALTIAVDDWARSTRRWGALIGARPVVVDFTLDGRKRARFASRSFATMDLIEAGLDVAAGDCEIVILVKDVAESLTALRRAGVAPVLDPATGNARVEAKQANGVSVVLTEKRPAPLGQPMTHLPYVLDITVADIETSAPVWDAILGVSGSPTSRATDVARQFEMRHYVTAGELHAIGLMAIPPNLFIKRDSLGSSHMHIVRTRGEGALCVGFLFKEGLDPHIALLPPDIHDLLLFEEPRTYQMGRNNMSHADQTGGVSVVIAQHFPGWEGDPRDARADA